VVCPWGWQPCEHWCVGVAYPGTLSEALSQAFTVKDRSYPCLTFIEAAIELEPCRYARNAYWNCTV